MRRQVVCGSRKDGSPNIIYQDCGARENVRRHGFKHNGCGGRKRGFEAEPGHFGDRRQRADTPEVQEEA